MLGFLLGLFRLVWLFEKGHQAVVLDNLALRQQLSVYKRRQKRPRLVGRDRWFWIALSEVWTEWRRALCIVHPDTSGRWQRERFVLAQLSNRSEQGGPPLSSHIRTLIRTLAEANPLWCAYRIHGELKKLGIEVSERTVSRILQTVKRPPSQTWKTFLQNHVGSSSRSMFCTNCVRRFSKSNWRGGTRIHQLRREIGVSISLPLV
jgi:putative transposase